MVRVQYDKIVIYMCCRADVVYWIGIRQVDSFSSTLFSIYINELATVLKLNLLNLKWCTSFRSILQNICMISNLGEFHSLLCHIKYLGVFWMNTCDSIPLGKIYTVHKNLCGLTCASRVRRHFFSVLIWKTYLNPNSPLNIHMLLLN